MNRVILSRRKFVGGVSLSALALGQRAFFAQGSVDPVVVGTPSGALRGERTEGVRVFRGIPYAEPPLRFRPAAKLRPWSGDRDATRFAAAAMQAGEPDIRQSEDCLYLNVWAPEGKGPFPVFVWVHGGGFVSGRSWDPKVDGAEFAKEGVVCVTVAYRLGVFGFLDVGPLLGTEYAGSGNNALRDLMLALEWVHGNIAAFGGDPARVTLGGESAGAKLTCILMGIPAAEPYFQQMISESGGAERVWPGENAARIARGFEAEWVNAGGATGAGLRTAPAEKLIDAQKSFFAQWPQHFPFRPELDGALLPQLPIKTIAGGSSRGKRLLIGTNREESALFLGAHPVRGALAADLGNMTLDRFAEVFQRYKAVYPEMAAERLLIRAVTAEEYWIPSVRVAEAHVRGNGIAWMYRLDFAETSGRFAGYSYHSLDIELVWETIHAEVKNAAAERALGRQVHSAWVSFIRGNAPKAEGLPVWPQYRSDSRETMVLDTKSRVESRPQEAELRLWDGVL